jgi:hypothetical protein
MNHSLPSGHVRHARATLLAIVAAIALMVGACAPAAAPTPTPSPFPSGLPASSTSPEPSIGPITSPEAAAAAVLASDPRFAGLTAQDPNLIGQCCFYVVAPTANGFAVTIEVGWGDCPAGCIDRHHWFYTVTTDGTVHLDREDGKPVPAGVPGSSGGTTGGPIGIRGIATAGPVCPVVRPNDPACADRPVAGATVHIVDATNTEVATLETDAEGAFAVTLPPGRYRVVADPVPGLMGTAAPVEVTVGAAQELVQLTYDTGIR